MADATHETDSVPTLESPTRAVAHERQRPLAPSFEGAREPEDVLALGEPAQTQERCPLGWPADLLSGFVGVAWKEALEVDAAVDDLGLAGTLGNRVLQLRRSQRETAMTVEARRTTYRVAAVAPGNPDVRNVLTMGGDDERGTGCERGDEAGRREEVRIDVRSESPRGSDRVACELQVTPSPAGAPIDDGSLDVMTTCDELALEIGDEHSEIRVVRARVHLRNEEDSQRGDRASPGEGRGTSRPWSPRPRGHSAGSGNTVLAVHPLVHVVPAVTRTTSPGSARTGFASA